MITTMKLPFLTLLLTFTQITQAQDWPEWRGIGAQGISAAKGLPET